MNEQMDHLNVLVAKMEMNVDLDQEREEKTSLNF